MCIFVCSGVGTLRVGALTKGVTSTVNIGSDVLKEMGNNKNDFSK
jgi:hypothetical protein